MSINAERDCVALGDGRMLCYDGADECFYVYRKIKTHPRDLSSSDLTKLVSHLASVIQERESSCNLTQKELDSLMAAFASVEGRE